MKNALQQFRQHQHYGMILVALAALMFSIKAIFIKLALQYQVAPVVLMCLRMMISMPFYLVVLARLPRNPELEYGPVRMIQVILLGLSSYYAAAYLDIAGLQYISANLERLIIYLYPTMVIILGVIFLGKSLNKTMVLCMLAAYVGIAIVFSKDMSLSKDVLSNITVGQFQFSSLTFGALLTLASAFCFACYVAFSEPVIKKLGSVRFTCHAMIVASAAIVLHFLVTQELSDLTVEPAVYIYAACIALFSTIIPSFLMSEGIQHIGSAKAGIIGTLGPVATLITAYFVLGDPLTVQHIVGMTVVVLSVFALSKAGDIKKPG
jgi:drug/metabolite transporter (DMT)-like permease